MRLTVVTLFLLLGFGSAHPTILYFNDAHELAPLEDGARGGLARVATLIDATRRENPETLVVFGGDLAGGTLFGTFRGAPIVEAFNKMGVDVANFGQHEFDFGAAVARQRVRESEFRWFSSNLTERDGHPFAGVPKTLLVERGGLKLGFIGLTTALKTSGAGGLLYSASRSPPPGRLPRRSRRKGPKSSFWSPSRRFKKTSSSPLHCPKST